MTFKLLCLGAAAALVIAPAAFAQAGGGMANPGGAVSGPAPTVDTPTNPAPQAAPAPVGPAQAADPSANVGSAANANATVGGTTDDASGTTSTHKKKAKHGSVNGSQSPAPSAATAPNSTTGAPQ